MLCITKFFDICDLPLLSPSARIRALPNVHLQSIQQTLWPLICTSSRSKKSGVATSNVLIADPNSMRKAFSVLKCMPLFNRKLAIASSSTFATILPPSADPKRPSHRNCSSPIFSLRTCRKILIAIPKRKSGCSTRSASTNMRASSSGAYFFRHS